MIFLKVEQRDEEWKMNMNNDFFWRELQEVQRQAEGTEEIFSPDHNMIGTDFNVLEHGGEIVSLQPRDLFLYTVLCHIFWPSS